MVRNYGVSGHAFIDREAVNNVLERRMFYQTIIQDLHGYSGFYDYGPPRCAIMSNLLASWRQVNFQIFKFYHC